MIIDEFDRGDPVYASRDENELLRDKLLGMTTDEFDRGDPVYACRDENELLRDKLLGITRRGDTCGISCICTEPAKSHRANGKTTHQSSQVFSRWDRSEVCENISHCPILRSSHDRTKSIRRSTQLLPVETKGPGKPCSEACFESGTSPRRTAETVLSSSISVTFCRPDEYLTVSETLCDGLLCEIVPREAAGKIFMFSSSAHTVPSLSLAQLLLIFFSTGT